MATNTLPTQREVAYALCRPPGHHAMADCAGGFCYLNNTAIAAHRLRVLGAARVAVIDIDVHHGNGTQAIFYERDDILTVSIHADPTNYFPLYSGYADERGANSGLGFNLNLPLEHGAEDDAVCSAVLRGLEEVGCYRPEALVVALGLDASKDDPIGVFDVTLGGFKRIAASLSALELPTALIQEGGYLCPSLPHTLVTFLKAFEAQANHAR